MAFDLSEKILEYLVKNDTLDTLQFSNLLGIDHQKIVGAVKSLQALGDFIAVEQKAAKKWELTDEGKAVAERGSHEAVVFNAIPPEGILQNELMDFSRDMKVGFSKAMSYGWITVTKLGHKSLVIRKVNTIEDKVQNHLRLIEANRASLVDEDDKQHYRKRKLLQQLVVKSYLTRKGKDFRTSVQKPESDLTAEMVVSGSWRERNFKPYNLDALGVPPGGGHLHPLLRVRAEFRQIFLEMGFTEMPTNNFTENSFWNFDALFQPQQHPARDAHDTFFLSSPRCSSRFPPEYLQKVKQVHSRGGYGSQGYGYDWKLEEAEKNLLRTHTTAVSARVLYLLAREGFAPSKYFSIDRVFRNETLDATHLAEFHQVEGVIADYNLTLGDLIGTLYEFFSKLGITQLQFKPAYNPYTEPSMEVFCYHTGLGKWIEVGNSGIFRPEMLLPMGLPEDVNVIAWGLSLERPTMIKYGLNNIRDLVGAKVDLQMVYDSPVCRLDKSIHPQQNVQHTERPLQKCLQHSVQHTESPLQKCPQLKQPIKNENLAAEMHKQELRWDFIHLQLQAVQAELQSLKLRYEKSKSYSQAPDKDLEFVIFSDPRHPPYSLVVLLKLLLNTYRVEISEHVHSSVSDISSELHSLFKGVGSIEGTGCHIKVTLIWKMIGKDPQLTLCPASNNTIVGEVNVARYLNRLLEQRPNPLIVYESQGELYGTQVDEWLDCIYKSVIRGENNRALPSIAAVLSTQCWLLGNSVSIADICLWSSLKQNPYLIASNSELNKWYESCCKHAWFVQND